MSVPVARVNRFSVRTDTLTDGSFVFDVVVEAPDLDFPLVFFTHDQDEADRVCDALNRAWFDVFPLGS